jgi:class 3 adenylate cyclase
MEFLEAMMKVLFVDNKPAEFERFMKLEFAKDHRDEIEYIRTPVGVPAIVEANPELRLIILDILWEEDLPDQEPIPAGLDVLRDLEAAGSDVPVVIYSAIDSDQLLNELLPEAERMGSYDWISKDEPRMIQSARFRRAYMVGRLPHKRPQSRAILARHERQRSGIFVSIMFIDMSGFTALTSEIGAERVIPLLDTFYAAVGSAVRDENGYLDKYIGDAVMAVFGAMPLDANQPQEVHVGRSVRAAKAALISALVQRAVIEKLLAQMSTRLDAQQIAKIGKCRVGIESGTVEVVRFERGNESEVTFIGTPVNIAARILNQADPSEIWIGQNAARWAQGVVRTVDTEYKNLPGKYQKHLIAT